MTDPLSRTSTYTYDGLGNLTAVTQLAGTASPSVTTLTYEPTYNRIASITDSMNNTVTFNYQDSSNQVLATDQLGNNWTLSLNSEGQAASFTDPAGDVWRFGYTGGDLTSVQDPLNYLFSYIYDGAGRLVSAIDPLGERTSYTYDALDHLLTVADPLNEVSQFGYDQNSNLVSVTDPKNTANPTQFLFDNMNRVYKRVDALGNADNYQYDLNGNLTCHTDRKGQISIFGYDGINRRTSAGYGATNCTSTSFQNSIAYTYDGGNRLRTAADSIAGTASLNYDGLDDLNYESTPQGTINYTFDAARRRTSMTVTGQTIIKYGYDAASHLQQISQGSAALALTYDTVGRRSSLVLPNGITVGYSYDADSNMTGITYSNGATTLGNLNYSYDALDRRTQAGGSFARVNLPAALTSASYNAANQITTWGSTSIAYDLNGNLQSDGTNAYTWDLRNQLSAISGGSTASFQYDGLYRRIAKTINATATAFLYDGWNITQELSGTTPTANLVTGTRLDQVFARTDSGGTKYFLEDALGSTLALTSTSAGILTQYTYEPFGAATASGGSSTNSFQFTGRENDGTGLYFYRSRYYKPGFERFASEDPIGLVGGINLFEYVGDNPMLYIDPFGLEPQGGTPNCLGGGGSGGSGGSGGGPGGPGSGPNGNGNPNGPGNRPISAGVNGPGFRLGYTLDPANNTLWLTYGLGLSTGTGGGSITWPGNPPFFPGPKAPSSGQSNSGGGSVGWPGTGLGLSLGSSGTLGSSFGNGLSGSPIPPFGGSLYHNFNIPLQLWPNPCQ
jgi:RHS repeat-associated protein